ncbi:MAG: extracellular solute-binding protein [Bacilli bacterium]|nr:extracellular solute-binding protein [Bacilli bacterium]
MNKKIKYLFIAPIALVCASGVSSCSSSTKYTLRILNSEDYIYLQDETDPESLPDMIDQFKMYIRENYPEYKDVEVVYDTSDTNETIYSELATGKSNYDLMNVSDYMAEKIISSGYAVPLDKEKIPNYLEYASEEIRGRLDNLTATQKVKDESGVWVDKVVRLEDYTVGYMWGTLGILFNPDYFANIADYETIDDFVTFSNLWNPKYKGTISIKNSMRDTFAMGLLHSFDADFEEILDEYQQAGETPEALEIYQEKFAALFNRCDEECVKIVENNLELLKKNIFGLEVDSGKQDIVTGKIGVDMAWSGDAVYSMDLAEDATKTGTLRELCYSVPEHGSNLWFDTWIMPNCSRSEEQEELAHLFLDFICDPVNAAQNMDYTGYTSFIAGEDVCELVRSWYDIRYEEVYYLDEDENEYAIYHGKKAIDEINEEDEILEVTYEDCLTEYHDDSKDDQILYAFEPYLDEEGEYIEEPLSYQDLLDHKIEIFTEEDKNKTYGDLLIVDSLDPENTIEEVDLTYFFGDDPSSIFYSDCYHRLVYYDEEGEEIVKCNGSVGRQFYCQYPDQETINRCGVMKDYGENNKLVMAMWENFKSDPLPNGSLTLFFVILGILLFLVALAISNVIIKKHIRKKRLLDSK